MEIGKLNRRISLQSLVPGQDAIGQPTMVWTTLATVWANVRYLNGVEVVKSDMPVSVVRASIRIRRRTDVLANMKAVLGTTVFDIKAVQDDQESRERIDLVCEAGANSG